MHMPISQEMKEQSLIQRRESALCWDMGMLPKGIDCMILHRERYSTVVMSNLTKLSECKQGAQGVTDSDYQLIAEFSEVTDHDSQSAHDTTQSDDDQKSNPPEL